MIVFSSKFSSIIRGVEKKVHHVFTYLFISIEGPFKKYTSMIGLTIFFKRFASYGFISSFIICDITKTIVSPSAYQR